MPDTWINRPTPASRASRATVYHIDMNGMEGLWPALPIEAHGIHDALDTRDGSGNGAIVIDVGLIVDETRGKALQCVLDAAPLPAPRNHAQSDAGRRAGRESQSRRRRSPSFVPLFCSSRCRPEIQTQDPTVRRHFGKGLPPARKVRQTLNNDERSRRRCRLLFSRLDRPLWVDSRRWAGGRQPSANGAIVPFGGSTLSILTAANRQQSRAR